MITHYNAFISYRHVKRDIAVAKEIQRSLEHFEIPKELQEKTGISKIERVFRDKDELSLAGDLTESIKETLENSDWLIVICSEEAKKSEWMKKELELFLTHHDLDHVLTVLSSGEPGDVIPDAISYRTVNNKLPDGSIKEELVFTEVLACDYRMSFRKARKEELPRLVSVMLNCSYDELVRRSEQYMHMRKRRIYAAFGIAASVVVGLQAFSIYRTKVNLQQSQINQSQYLATESLNYFAIHDKITAIQLALAALPDEKDDRPVTGAAEYALATALGAYEIPSSSPEMYTIKKYSSEPHFINDFIIGPDGMTMLYIDYSNSILLVDLDNNETIIERSYQDVSAGSTDDHIILADGSRITGLSWEDGTELFSTDIGMFVNSFSCGKKLSVFANDNTFTVLNEYGEKVLTHSFPEKYWILKISISNNDNYVLINCLTEEGTVLYVFSIEDNALIQIPGYHDDILSCLITEKGYLFILRPLYDTNHISYSADNTYYFYNMKYILCCINYADGKEIWKHEIDCKEEFKYDLIQSFYTDADGYSHECLICNVSDTQLIIDTENGNLLKKTVFPSLIAGMKSVAENIWETVLTDGSIGKVCLDNDFFSVQNSIEADIYSCKSFGNENTDGLIVLDSERRNLTRYESRNINPNFTQMDLNADTADTCVLRDGLFAAISYNYIDDISTLRLYDTDSNRPLHEVTLGSKDSSSKKIYIMSDLSSVLSISEYSGDTLYITDAESGNVKTYIQGKGDKKEASASYIVTDKSFLLYSVDGGKVFLSVYDAKKEEEKITQTSIENAESIITFAVNDTNTYCVAEIIRMNGTELYLINIHDGSSVMLDRVDNDKDIQYTSSIYNPKIGDTIAVYRTKDSVRVKDLDGNMLCNLQYDMATVLSFECRGDDIFIAESGGVLTEYNCYGVAHRSWFIFIKNDNEYNDYKTYKWSFYDDILMFGCSDLNVIDISQNQSKAYIEYPLAFDSESEKIVLIKYRDFVYGYFSICTTEDLIEMGRDYIKDEELSDNQKKRYGIM